MFLIHSRHCYHLLKKKVLMDLSKTFDAVTHDLLIAKLNAFGLQHDLLKVRYSYLTNGRHKIKIIATFSLWEQLIQRVP